MKPPFKSWAEMKFDPYSNNDEDGEMVMQFNKARVGYDGWFEGLIKLVNHMNL